MSEPLMVDEGRYMEGDRTGIFVRAKRKGGSWESVDIYSLDYPSLTLATEPGNSLRGAGFRLLGTTPGKSWSVKSRPRVDKHPLQEKM